MADVDFSTLPTAALGFRPQCPGCTPESATADAARPCSFYDCPGLPEELKVTCELCMFDFAAQDGQVKCDHDTCETALKLQKNVETYQIWVQLLRAEMAPPD